MFDDQTTGNGVAQAAKAEDIFSGLDQGAVPAMPSQPQAQLNPLDLGLAGSQLDNNSGASSQLTNKNLLIVGGIVLGLLAFAIGVWLILIFFKGGAGTDTPIEVSLETDKAGSAISSSTYQVEIKSSDTVPVSSLPTEAGLTGVESIINNDSASTTMNPGAGLNAEPAQATGQNPNVSDDLIPEAVKQAATAKADTDGDGLSDEEEQQIGTYGDRKDTDGDGLNDFEEVKTYLTNPKNVDSDSDGFKDGDEVKNGYNPKGAGKLSN